MSFQSSPGIILFLILLLRLTTFAQSPETVVATVNGTPITLKQVDGTIGSTLLPLQQQLYSVRKVALDNLITARLLETEARAQSVSIEELRQRLTLGEVNVTKAQVEDAFAENATYFAAMSPDEARERLRLDLENQARMKNYRAALEGLRKKWTVKIDFATPLSDTDVSPAKGATKAAVTIVEFSDFECPYCVEVQDTLKQIGERYAGDVRFVFKHLPLEGHRNSFPAARAAYCAGEQDRFWQFHDALFAAGNLSPPEVFEQIAVDIGLGVARFRACVNSEQSRAAVLKDLETARSLRIDSTPSFFVNGRLIKGALSFAEWQKIIERELTSQN
jgi:predicted DsbA family dithiol-disulfide isomerase